MKKFVLFLAVLFFVLLPRVVFSQTSSLVGSKDSLRKQNEMADIEGLPRIRNLKELREFKDAKILLPLTSSVKIDKRLDEERRFSLPRVNNFLDDYVVSFINFFGRQFQVNSAIRTAEFQLRLFLTNPNAAPVDGDRSSPHLTGSAIDIAKLGMTEEELRFMRHTLLRLEEQNVIEASEEWGQPCFHITVFASYSKDYLDAVIREPY